MAWVGATTRPAPASPAATARRYQSKLGGGLAPRTASNHEQTHECATSSTGAPNDSAPWANSFRWTTSGRSRRESSSSQPDVASTSSHGSSIHSSRPGRSWTVSPGTCAASTRCASSSRPPRAAREVRTPRRDRAAASSSA